MLPEKMHDQIQESLEERYTLDSVWDMANTFLWGRQAEGAIRTLSANPQQARALRVKSAMYNPNLLIDYYRTAMSRLAIKQPSATILPTTGSTEDIAKALATQEGLIWLWWGMEIPTRWNKTIPYLLTKGNVGYRCYYDEEMDSPQLEVYRPEDLCYEPGTEDPDESEWVAVRKRPTRRALIAKFPDFEKEINEASQEEGDDRKWLGWSVPWTNTNKKLKNRVDVWYVYARDGSQDVGLFLGGGNETWLWEGTVPKGVMGIHHLGYTKMPESPWSMGLIENLMSPQAAYNKGRKQQMDYIDLVNKPKVLIPYKADVSAGAFNDVAGQKIRFKQGYEPKYLNLSSWPTGAERQLNRIREEMNDLAGMQNTSLGKREGGATSGVAIRSLAAQDINKLETTQNNTEVCFSNIFRDALILLKTHLTQEKSVRSFDNFGNPMFSLINTTSYTDDPDVHIDTGSMFVIRAREEEDRILTLAERGFIPPEEVMSKVSIQTGRRAKLEEMRDLESARGVLKVAEKGVLGPDPETGVPMVMDITIYVYDNLAAYRQVFGDCVRDTEKFYNLPLDRQTAIHDIFVAVMQGPVPGSMVVYPRPELPPMPEAVPGAPAPPSAPQAPTAPKPPRGVQARGGASPMPVQTPGAEATGPAPGGEAM